MKTTKSQKTTSNEALEIVSILEKEYHGSAIPLAHRNAFELLLAVILSAQCTDERVNKITPLLFPKDRGLTPDDILEMGEEKVKSIIRPCGYFNAKTKAIMSSAADVKKLGEVPSKFEELRKLRGVGAKTAQVIQAQWFNMPAFPVDTHIHRVCNRLGLADSGKNRDKTERQVKAIVPQEKWSDLHLHMIYFGRQTCTARKPKCFKCPLFKHCKWPEKMKFLKLPS